ncbi:MAG: FAD-binding protein [Armatimonadetes bacterium]|nr:FAD-binding protein [Armatimonadota bacterium]
MAARAAITTGPVRRLRRSLERALGRDAVLWREADLCLYSYDSTLARGQPDLVALPEDTRQLSDAVKAAADLGIPIVARGAGTCLSGGPVPTHGGLVLALNRMDRLLDLDVRGRMARVQAGMVNAELQRLIAPHGLFFAPDPASQLASTIGGNVAENAGGPHCLKYGVTANHVSAATVVLADGEIVEMGGRAAAGDKYDLLGVLLGSEGTLGIVAEVSCRLSVQPQALTTMLAAFGAVQPAIQTVTDIVAAGLLPATLEMMDRPLIESVQAAFDAGYPGGAAAVLIIEVDGLAVSMDRQARAVEEICRSHGALSFERAQSEADRQRLWKGRKGAMASLVNIRPNTICTDVVVPRSALPDMLEAVVALGEARGMTIGSLFHAGDGNLHPQVLFDARDPAQVEAAHEVDAEIVALAIERGGVLSGEHGIGCCKRPWMEMMFSETDLRVQWVIKDAFDPAGLLNPGKVLPDRLIVCDAVHAGSRGPQVREHCPADASEALAPRDPEEAAEVLGELGRFGSAAWICGSGRLQCPVQGATAVSTRMLNKITLFDQENLTVTVQAGMRWDDLQRHLSETGQFVPLRPACPERTVGGVVARDAYSAQRFVYGSVPDVLLGASVALPTGDLVKAGSRCVKNVSGYAVHRLLVGSWGTLGLITDVTLRTRPVPEVVRCLMFGGGGAQLGRIAGELLHSLLTERLQPASMHVAPGNVLGPNWQDTDGVILLGLEGLSEEVAFLESEAVRHAGRLGLKHTDTVCEDAALDLYARLSAAAETGFSVTGAPQSLYSFRDSADADCAIVLDVAAGALSMNPSGNPAELRPVLEAQCASEGLTVTQQPPFFRSPGAEGALATICRRIKTAVDPGGVLPTLI